MPPDYAKELGISYTTGWRWWKKGKLPHPAHQTESGLVIVEYTPPSKKEFSGQLTQKKVAIYAPSFFAIKLKIT